MSDTAFALIFDGATPTLDGAQTVDDGAIPVQRFRKDLIALGTFKHPTLGWKLKVTRDRAKAWVETFNKMLAAGCEIPVNRDHKPGVDNHVGYLVGLEFTKGQLFGIVEARGKQAIEDCQRVNRVSIEVLPDYIDGKGTHYGEALVGLAITAQPVVNRQDGFVPIAASTGAATAGPAFEFQVQGDPTVDFAALSTLLGVEVTEDNCVESVKAAIEERDGKVTAATEQVTELTTKVTALEANAEAGDKTPKAFALDADVAEGLAEGIESRVEGLVACGAVTPAVAKNLTTLLAGKMGGRPAMLLSKQAPGVEGDQSIARQVIDVLKENKPVETGERTGLQVLTREVPGGSEAAPGFNPDVNKDMIAMANTGMPAAK